MNGVLKEIDLETMRDLISQQPSDSIDDTSRKILLASGEASRTLYAGTIGDKLLCFVGLAPPTLLSDRAYLWLYVTPDVANHKVMFGRHAIRLVMAMKQVYPIIVGHCDNGRSIAWLRSLGATFLEPQGPIIPFEIRS